MDPWCNPNEASEAYGLMVTKTMEEGTYDSILVAVAHDEFKDMGIEAIRKLGRSNHVLYDLKCVLAKDDVDLRL
jgi:UDP-N-acetyl-D-galactosamine dehydrogenase